MPTIRFEDIRSIEISPDDYIVFGGTFDPFHEEHLQIVKRLSSYFRKIFIAPTAQNVFKSDAPTNYQDRLKMIELVLGYENLDFKKASSQITILDFQYQYAEEVVNKLRQERSGTLYWAVGEDIYDSLSSWRNWEELNLNVIAMPVIVSLHATDVRKNLKLLHPALINFVKEKKLYAEN